MTAVCKQTDVHLCLHLSACIEQLQIIPIVSHFQSLGLTANVEVQLSYQARLILDLRCKTAFKGVNVMQPFGPVQQEWDKQSVSQIGCISMSLGSCFPISVQVPTAESLMPEELSNLQ